MKNHLTLALATSLMSASTLSFAEPMTFHIAGAAGRWYDSDWIQATGTITATTHLEFKRWLESPAAKYAPKRIRFHSPGGVLDAGLQLGLYLRENGYATEVGLDKTVEDFGPEYLGGRIAERARGKCASACAYAFLGGVERRLDSGSRLGFHQFYNLRGRLIESLGGGPTVRQGAEQERVAELLQYFITMDVDPSVLVTASKTAPNDMYYISSGKEARKAKLEYDDRAWSEWTYNYLPGGVYATSERLDGNYTLAATCIQETGELLGIFTSKTGAENEHWNNSIHVDWVKQCLVEDDRVMEFSFMGTPYTVNTMLISGDKPWVHMGQIIDTNSLKAEPIPTSLFDNYSACTDGQIRENRQSPPNVVEVFNLIGKSCK